MAHQARLQNGGIMPAAAPRAPRRAADLARRDRARLRHIMSAARRRAVARGQVLYSDA